MCKSRASTPRSAWRARDLPGALRHSSDMLRELRTSLLTPRNYYELYMKVCDELRHLDQFFQQLVADGTPAADIYERAQACGDVLPRYCYLLITAERRPVVEVTPSTISR